MKLDDWRDRSIYFVLVDRFFNGDRSNDDQGRGEFDPSSPDAFHGGDLQGLRLKLPHIRRLGFDALWLSPIFHNQWLNPYVGVRGYHGYWPYDFEAVDPHFGTLEDFKSLVREAHELGLKVIQDIVVNHTGNFFSVGEDGVWREAEGAAPPFEGPKAPRDPVFSMNNPNMPEHRAAAVYNFTPNIADFKDRGQTLRRALGDLDDINLESPLAVERMKEIYRFWIREAGVDGFRVDTVYYTPEAFYERFLYDREPGSPGVKTFALQRGKKDFLVFGEVWCYDYPSINGYLQQGAARRLDSAVDFPLHEALVQVFFRGAPPARLAAALRARRPRRPLWVNFLDNHDVERIWSRAGPAKARQALAALFCLPGLPCVHYGTEARLAGARDDMFDEAHWDEGSESFRFLRSLLELRKAQAPLRRGSLRWEAGSHGAGVLAWSRRWKGRRLLAVFNTAATTRCFDLASAAPAAKVLLASEGVDAAASPLLLPADAFLLVETAEAPRAPGGTGLKLSAPAGALRGRIRLGVRAPRGLAELALVCDGDWDGRRPLASGAGEAELESAELGNGRHRLQLVARSRSGGAVLSELCEVRVANPYRSLGSVRAGQRRYAAEAPGDPSYGGQLRLLSLRASSSGRDLRLRLRMGEVTDSWNPPNGYDHVYFSVFLELPGRPGPAFLPKLGPAPEGFRFSLGFLLYGWGGLAYSSEGAGPSEYGRPLPWEVRQQAHPARGEVAFTFPPPFFSGLASLRGVRVLATTWDGYLGELRAVAPRRENWSFFGPPDAPKIFDALELRL